MRRAAITPSITTLAGLVATGCSVQVGDLLMPPEAAESAKEPG